jgi:hypothetical protein
MLRRLLIGLAVASTTLGASSPAWASGGNYVFAGGTPYEQSQVRQALGVSSFNWSIVPAQITIEIAPGLVSEAVPGTISLDANLLDTGELSWGVVQHEYAHEVDFTLFDSAIHAELQSLLGAADWCYEVPGLTHAQQGCERFASTLAWAYWPVAENCMRPGEVGGESAAMPPAAFRALMTALLGPSVLNTPTVASPLAPGSPGGPVMGSRRVQTVTR